MSLVENDTDVETQSGMELNRDILRQISEFYKTAFEDDNQEKTLDEHYGRSTTRRFLNKVQVESKPSQKHITLPLIGEIVGYPVSLAYQKATVMVIGNISAGKSTFVNWFVQEAVQKTGMAIETSGFTFITSGRCVTEIGGESTLALRPHLQELCELYPGFLRNLSLKTCPSKNGRLKLLDIVDTPGLADGELQYPFDVEKIILDMTRYVDLFLVFFDPIGQALGRRVLSVVERLTDICPDKVRFCLTKVDQIRTEEERIKVMCQTTQSLTAKIKSRHGFDLIPIYIPGAVDGTYFFKDYKKENTGIVNRLDDLVEDIQRSTELRVQDALNGLHYDTTVLQRKVKSLLDSHNALLEKVNEHILASRKRKVFRCVLYFCMALLACVHCRILLNNSKLPFVSFILSKLFELMSFNSLPIFSFIDKYQDYLTPERICWTWIFLLVCFVFTLRFKKQPYVSGKDKLLYKNLLEYQNYLKNVKNEWKNLNKKYLNHAVAEPSESSSINNSCLNKSN